MVREPFSRLFETYLRAMVSLGVSAEAMLEQGGFAEPSSVVDYRYDRAVDTLNKVSAEWNGIPIGERPVVETRRPWSDVLREWLLEARQRFTRLYERRERP